MDIFNNNTISTKPVQQSNKNNSNNQFNVNTFDFTKMTNNTNIKQTNHNNNNNNNNVNVFDFLQPQQINNTTQTKQQPQQQIKKEDQNIYDFFK